MRQKPWAFWSRIFYCGLLLATGFGADRAVATSTLMEPPENSVKPQSQLDAEASDDMAVFIPAADNRDTSLPQPFKAGPVVFRPHLNYQYSYTEGLLAAPSNSVNSSVHTIALGATVDLGRHWTLDYTPTIQVYSDKAFNNNVGHMASLMGSVSYEDWVFSLSQTYSKSDSTLVETATQTEQQQFSTSLNASCQLNEKFSTDMSLGQQISDVTGGQGIRAWSLSDWLNYQIAQRIFIGIGGTFQYVDVDTGPNQLSESLQARLRWRATEKISFSVRGGLECRQTLNDAYKDSLSPIYGADLQYAPFKHTQISLYANRSSDSSQLYNILSQSTESTSVGLTLNQRLFENYNLSTGVNYTHADYKTTYLILSNVRTDDNYSISVGLNRTIFKRGSVGVSYQYGKNTSNQAGYSYLSNQIGLQASFAY